MSSVRTPEELVLSAHAVIDAAQQRYKPVKMFALFSGGHDSLSVTHAASKHPRFSGVVHIDTSVGLPETQQFVRDTCAREGWPLYVLKSSFTYLQLVVRYGFPGPAAHRYMYRYLKERPLAEFVASQKTKFRDSIMLVGGMRTQESVRRMGHVEPMNKLGAHLWVSAIHDWTAYEVSSYVTAQGLKRNAVKDLLHLSGECFCGAYAKSTEREMLAMFYPHMDDYLTKCEAVVAAASAVPNIAIRPEALVWGCPRTATARPALALVPVVVDDFNEAESGEDDFFSMCWQCRQEDAEPEFNELVKVPA